MSVEGVPIRYLVLSYGHWPSEDMLCFLLGWNFSRIHSLPGNTEGGCALAAHAVRTAETSLPDGVGGDPSPGRGSPSHRVSGSEATLGHQVQMNHWWQEKVGIFPKRQIRQHFMWSPGGEKHEEKWPLPTFGNCMFSPIETLPVIIHSSRHSGWIRGISFS